MEVANSKYNNVTNFDCLVFREDSLEATEILANDSLGTKQTAKKFAVV